MRKRILVVLACVIAFGWTCLPTMAASANSNGTRSTVSDPNEKGTKKECPKHKKHEGKKKGQKKGEDSNSTGTKS